jgi:hypothetical protein
MYINIKDLPDATATIKAPTARCSRSEKEESCLWARAEAHATRMGRRGKRDDDDVVDMLVLLPVFVCVCVYVCVYEFGKKN